MPYRRLPKSDPARLKALKVLLDNNDIYTARNRFIDWKYINEAQPLYDRLLTATQQHRVTLATQTRHAPKCLQLQHKAAMYVSHFLQVLLLSVERGEVKRAKLPLYGLGEDTTTVPNLKSADALLEWAPKVIAGERARMAQGGRPIYNPTIGMVSTHFDIFAEAYKNQQALRQRTAQAAEAINRLRPACDELILQLWNAIEEHFAGRPLEERVAEGRRFGIIYYYRRHEPRLSIDLQS